jgi:flagellar biosynthetic protein FliP
LILLLLCSGCFAVESVAPVQSIPMLLATQTGSTVSYSLSIKIIALMAVLTVLPALLITMTAFTRIIIVMAILRQALGIPNIPSNQILIGLSLIMTLFVMMPVIQKANDTSLQPYIQGKLNEQQTFDTSISLLKTFMLKQTRKVDLKMFADLSKTKIESKDDPSLLIIMPAYITSELKTAFISLPFKLLFFVLVDGWGLVVTSLITSFRI